MLFNFLKFFFLFIKGKICVFFMILELIKVSAKKNLLISLSFLYVKLFVLSLNFDLVFILFLADLILITKSGLGTNCKY